MGPVVRAAAGWKSNERTLVDALCRARPKRRARIGARFQIGARRMGWKIAKQSARRLLIAGRPTNQLLLAVEWEKAKGFSGRAAGRRPMGSFSSGPPPSAELLLLVLVSGQLVQLSHEIKLLVRVSHPSSASAAPQAAEREGSHRAPLDTVVTALTWSTWAALWFARGRNYEALPFSLALRCCRSMNERNNNGEC